MSRASSPDAATLPMACAGWRRAQHSTAIGFSARSVDPLAANFTIAKAIDTAVRGSQMRPHQLEQQAGRTRRGRSFGADRSGRRARSRRPADCAAGNGHRQQVIFRRVMPLCLAVSALGRTGIFSERSPSRLGDATEPFGQDGSNFIAEFSNIGTEIDLTAPGSGIISTVPGGYGVMSGTSMACPAVTGIAARLLARNQELLTMDRGPERSARLAQLVRGTAMSLGFSAELQGAGLLQEQGEA